MAREHILVIEDEEDIQELLRYNLQREGYRVSLAASGERGYQLICSEKPDLVVLDLMLPGMDGLEVCRRVKQDVAVRHIPLVMASAKGEESDVVVGLELGADDYLTKPFSPKVLVARIKTVLRRKAREVQNEECVLVREELTLDPVRMLVKVSDVSVDLTATEYRVLHFLARRPGWVFTRQQIVDSVKGEDYPVTERSVDVQLVGLRKKLGPAADMIETVRGIGYRFRE
ncbi:MAG: response regulator transcription factor [Kiritimatiellae bacterium]|nr:response regulator transcription factor [Kiritimatiellia bacterium]